MPGSAYNGFRNDQFYDFGSTNTGEASNAGGQLTGAGIAVRGADNPPFVYPDRLVRMDTGDGFNPHPLKRGYIRSLLTYANGENVPIRKCQFQFNPDRITQSVDSNTSMLNFLQQDPAQYAQPMPSNVNMTFNILFDRSMELNNPTGGPVLGSEDPWVTNDPSQVGVLRDLANFYAVIGQGLSTAQFNYVSKILNDQLIAEANNSTADTVDTDLADAQSAIPDFLSMNLANSAFLLPMPVRVVFSSLYIVEGLVTNTTVSFTKFNTAMVPMQCALSVTMEAKYIGFAKKNTFFTYVLEEREKQERQQKQEEEDAKKAMYDAFGALASKMTIGAIHHFDADEFMDGDMVNDDSVTSVMALLKTRYTPFNMGLTLPNATGDGDSISNLFDSNVPPFITVGADITVYGPFDPLTNFRGNLATYAKTNGRVVLTGKLISTNARNGSATTKQEWDNLADDGAITQNTLFQSANGYFTGGPVTYDAGAKWHIVNVNGFVQAKIGDEHIKGEGSSWTVVKSGELNVLTRTIGLRWPTYTPIDYLSGTTTTTTVTFGSVPPDNLATQGSQPGTVSRF